MTLLRSDGFGASALTAWRRLALAACLLSATMFGQSFLGSVVGTITDQSGAAVPEVKVTLTNTGTNEERTATTSNLGEYQFRNLIPGSYKMAAEKQGFARLVRDQVTVAVQGEIRIDGALTVGGTTQTIEITSEIGRAHV